tara:strand:+ start:49 stop:897 length:849 start_codon:yes stop_codon:yes gene_type:complete
MKFKVSSGLNIAASSWGRESDPLVILLHGGGQTRHAWGETGKKLSQNGFYVLALDLRGHGDSDWHPDGEYGVDNYKKDIVSILKEVKKPAAFIGASLGGMTSLSIAGDPELREKCWALVMVDIGLYPNLEGSQEIVEFMNSGSKGFASIEEAAESVANYLPHRKRPRDNRGLEKNLRLKDDGRYYWHWDPRFLDSRPKDIPEDYKEKQKAFAERVETPTLLIKGAMSNILTQNEVDDFLQVITHSKFVEIKDAAHMVAGDRNDIFAAAAIDFLENHSPLKEN